MSSKTLKFMIFLKQIYENLHLAFPEHSSVLLCLINFLIIIIIILITSHFPKFKAVQPVLTTVLVSLSKHLLTFPLKYNSIASL